MTRTITGLITAVLLMAMVGCQSVDSTAMLGQKSGKVAKAIQGVWQANDGVIYVKAAGHEGQVQLASVQWKKDKWQLQTFTAYATTLGGKAYLNLESPADATSQPSDPPTYHFIRLLYDVNGGQGQGRNLVVFGPNVGAFAKAVDDSKLAGKVQMNKQHHRPQQVHLTASADALGAFVQAHDSSKLFEDNQPLVLIRLDKTKR